MVTEDETEELKSGYYMDNGVLMNKSVEKVVPYSEECVTRGRNEPAVFDSGHYLVTDKS